MLRGGGTLGSAVGLEVTKSGRQAVICVQCPRKNTFLHLLGKVRMIFFQYLPLTFILIRARKSNSPKRTNSSKLSLIFTFHTLLKKKAAFTLAEVLITLGIIGVVAAITLPTLITKHQKHVTVNRLKKAVSSFEQAITRAQADYGDMSGWTFLQSGTDLSTDSDSVKAEREIFIKNYIMKYMQISKDCGLDNVNKCQTYMTTSLDKSSFKLNINYGRMFITSDGTLYSIMIDNYMITDDDGGQTAVTNGHLLVTVDLNGAGGPNIYGRDLFIIDVSSANKKIALFGAGRDRETLKNNSAWACNSRTSRRFYCGALIQQDGWQIKEDYLWR